MVRTALGLMSGTSLDGIDVALLRTDGERAYGFGPARTFPYSGNDRDLMRDALAAAGSLADRNARPGVLAAAEEMVTRRHGEAVETFLAESGTDRAQVDLVGFHGQTVFHSPDRGLTVQIGDGQALADRLGLPVVWDLRAADVAAGGQGAPLVPVFHRALMDAAGLQPPAAFLNVGGVANVTFIDTDGGLLSFDTGPGNALLDDWVRQRRGWDFDADGSLAARGRVSDLALRQLLAHPYFDVQPPKSLDRNAFSLTPLNDLSDADGAATLVQFTAVAILASVRFARERPHTWVICGGGRRNAALMRALGEVLDPATVIPAESVGLDGDAVEAQAFAFLAVRSADGKPFTFPLTTGVPAPMSGGRISRPGAA